VPEGAFESHPAVDRVRAALTRPTWRRRSSLCLTPRAPARGGRRDRLRRRADRELARVPLRGLGRAVARDDEWREPRDTARVAAIVGEPIGKADAAFVRAATGFVIGGVAPVGHVAPVRTLIDRDLFRHTEIWAAAGHPHTVFRLTPDTLVRLTGGAVVEVA
jgi:hypothetical protein